MEGSVVETVGYEVSRQRLQELADHVRTALPLSTAITRLQLNCEAGAVVFTWCGRQFVLTPMLQVFELRGTKLYLTEISVLIQALVERHVLQKPPVPYS